MCSDVAGENARSRFSGCGVAVAFICCDNTATKAIQQQFHSNYSETALP